MQISINTDGCSRIEIRLVALKIAGPIEVCIKNTLPNPQFVPLAAHLEKRKKEIGLDVRSLTLYDEGPSWYVMIEWVPSELRVT